MDFAEALRMEGFWRRLTIQDGWFVETGLGKAESTDREQEMIRRGTPHFPALVHEGTGGGKPHQLFGFK
jgi:hypothetical protein